MQQSDILSNIHDLENILVHMILSGILGEESQTTKTKGTHATILLLVQHVSQEHDKIL